MAGDSVSHTSGSTRVALGDITNRPVKRCISSVLGTLARISGNGKNLSDDEGDSQLGKKTCLGLENVIGEKIKAKGLGAGNEEDLHPLKGTQPSCILSPSSGNDILQESIVPVVKAPIETTQTSDSFDSVVHPLGDDLIHVTELGDASRDSCLSSSSMPADSGPSDRDCSVALGKLWDNGGKSTSDCAHSNSVCEAVTRVCKNDNNGLGHGNLASRGLGECSGLAKHQGRGFELERCSGLKSNTATLGADIDLIKNCSCSFCKKAAFIWSDLHYQDIKGRIGALRKSQKEAGTLVQRFCRSKATDSSGHGNVNKSSSLESDLIGHWKSLFLHMEDILIRESNQLQDSYFALKDLRDNCKVDLELNGMPPDRQKSASNACGD